METFQVESCVRGHHIYKVVWSPSLGEVLQCTRELENTKECYTLTVVRRSTVVGHIPQDCSCKCPVLSEELFAVKSLVHGVILKIFLKVGWRYLANNLTFSHRADSAPYRARSKNFNIGGFKFGDPRKYSPNRQIKPPAKVSRYTV